MNKEQYEYYMAITGGEIVPALDLPDEETVSSWERMHEQEEIE